MFFVLKYARCKSPAMLFVVKTSYNIICLASKNKVTEDFVMKHINSLCRYKWGYKYHIVFELKYRK